MLLDVSYERLPRDHGETYYMVHRADFIDLLVRTARKVSNITIETGAKVVEYDCDGGRVRIESGTWYSSDLIIAADGAMPRLVSACC